MSKQTGLNWRDVCFPIHPNLTTASSLQTLMDGLGPKLLCQIGSLVDHHVNEGLGSGHFLKFAQDR